MKECTILLVTHNKHKVEEIRSMLQEYSQSVVYKVLSLDAIPEKVEIVEDGTTFEENALAKNVSLIRWLFHQKSNVIEELFANKRAGCWRMTPVWKLTRFREHREFIQRVLPPVNWEPEWKILRMTQTMPSS